MNHRLLLSRVDIYDSANRPSPVLEELLELVRYRDLAGQMIIRGIKTRYKRSFLGVAWTMLNPLLTMLVLSLIFSTVFRFAVENYAVYLLSGLILWNFFSQTTTTAMSEMLWGGGLFHRIYVPKGIFAISALGAGLVNLVVSLGPLFLIMLITGTRIHTSVLFLPIPILLAAAFTLGVALFLSGVAVFFADLLPVYGVILTIWLYMTPVIYPQEIVPETFRWILRINPVSYLVEIFRSPIYGAALPDWETLAIAAALSVGSLVMGWWLFARRAHEYAYRL